MTVHSPGSPWTRRLLDACQVSIFGRVTSVYLEGPQYRGDLLPHLARLRSLQQLDLVDTSIPDGDLEQWRRQHPRVAVKSTRTLAAR